MKKLPPGVTIYAGGHRYVGEAPEELHPPVTKPVPRPRPNKRKVKDGR